MDHFVVRPLIVLATTLLLSAGTAAAGRHIVQKGETLEHIARAYGCSVDAIERANKLQTTLVKPGTVIDVPACSLRSRAQLRTAAKPDSDDRRASQALAVIDGVTGGASAPTTS